jgi:hypothetical protein
MAATWNDGSIPYGAGAVITINAVGYIPESVEIQRTTQAIERRNADNEPSGSVGVADFVKGTATLQCASTSTAIPLIGLTFSYTDDSGVGAETMIVEQVSKPRTQGDATKFNISFRKKYT